MGDKATVRCTRCNRFGNKELDNFCRACDNEVFKEKVYYNINGSAKVLESVLLEFGLSSIDSLKREDRSRFINMIKRRRPNKRSGHMVHDASHFEKFGYSFVEDSESIKLIKGVPDIEKLG